MKISNTLSGLRLTTGSIPLCVSLKILGLGELERNVDIQNASCVHVTCLEEMEHLRAKRIESPMVVIPNPVDVANLSKVEFKDQGDKCKVGYLGLIYLRKNIDWLIAAWAELSDHVKQREWLIMGAGNVRHEDFLKSEANWLGLKSIAFPGFLNGQPKSDAISSLSYLEVFSNFENFE